jgi:hypothetical protein
VKVVSISRGAGYSRLRGSAIAQPDPRGVYGAPRIVLDLRETDETCSKHLVARILCDAWRRFCHAHHLEPSMSRRGNCWDHAVAESFFRGLKKERIKKRMDKTWEMANAEIYEYIEMFYNRTRRHSHLSGFSPEAFEVTSQQA